jgi:bzd-type benzoyl-CoA reductase Q subunit
MAPGVGKLEFWRWPEGIWVNPDLDPRKAGRLTAGIDVGSVSSQAVVLTDGDLYAFGSTRTGADSSQSAIKALKIAFADTGLTERDLDYCIGTGYGRVNVPMAQRTITEIACHARGASFMYGPEVRTVLDMGGQDCKAITTDDRGKVLNFIMNDKCAAGTGRGMEVFAELIGIPVWEIGERSLRVEDEPPVISSTCVVFAKTEVIGLLEDGVSEDMVMAAYCSAMAHRVTELLNRLGVREKLVITGGIAKNEGVVRRIEKELGAKTPEKIWHDSDYRSCPFDTQIAGALGAALFADERLERGKVKSVKG